MPTTGRLPPVTVLTAYFAFIVIGMTAGLLGVAWIAIQAEFGLPLDAVGILLTLSTVGYLISSFGSGIVASRIGFGRMFTAGAVLLAGGLLAYGLSPTWLLLIMAAAVSGVGNGLIDAGLNAYMAAHHNARQMNWLHACFGIGVTTAPIIMTIAVTGPGWRWGYVVVCAFAALLIVAFFLSRRLWLPPITQQRDAPVQARRRILRATLRSPLVWMSILLILVYAGCETIPGQWGFSLFTQERGMTEQMAGFWVSLYWASFTIGRLFFGVVAPRLPTRPLQRGCMVGLLAGALLFWWNPTDAVGVLGLMVMGFAQAPLFPLFVLETPKLMGEARASYAIGFQVAGAGIGVALLPSLAGILAQRTSLNVIPPFLVVTIIVLMIIAEALPLLASSERPLALEAAGD